MKKVDLLTIGVLVLTLIACSSSPIQSFRSPSSTADQDSIRDVLLHYRQSAAYWNLPLDADPTERQEHFCPQGRLLAKNAWAQLYMQSIAARAEVARRAEISKRSQDARLFPEADLEDALSPRATEKVTTTLWFDFSSPRAHFETGGTIEGDLALATQGKRILEPYSELLKVFKKIDQIRTQHGMHPHTFVSRLIRFMASDLRAEDFECGQENQKKNSVSEIPVRSPPHTPRSESQILDSLSEVLGLTSISQSSQDPCWLNQKDTCAHLRSEEISPRAARCYANQTYRNLLCCYKNKDSDFCWDGLVSRESRAEFDENPKENAAIYLSCHSQYPPQGRNPLCIWNCSDPGLDRQFLACLDTKLGPSRTRTFFNQLLFEAGYFQPAN